MCRHIAKYGVVLIVLLTLGSLVSWAQLVTQPPVYTVDYFPNLDKYDGLKKVVNTGQQGDTDATGTLCDLIYTFHKEQLTECCGCRVTPNGSRDFDVNKNFNSNNLLGAPFAELVVKQLSAGPKGASSDAVCDPTAPTALYPGLISWAVKVQVVGSLAPGITETASQQALVSQAEGNDLIEDCAVLTELGSGQGICTCGTYD